MTFFDKVPKDIVNSLGSYLGPTYEMSYVEASYKGFDATGKTYYTSKLKILYPETSQCITYRIYWHKMNGYPDMLEKFLEDIKINKSGEIYLNETGFNHTLRLEWSPGSREFRTSDGNFIGRGKVAEKVIEWLNFILSKRPEGYTINYW